MPPKKRAAPKNQCKLHCCVLSDEDRARIKATLDDYRPGQWAEQINYGPACHCGVAGAKEGCPRHE